MKPEVIAIIALVISAFSLGWNVYRDVVLKPKLKVYIRISAMVYGSQRYSDCISVFATNHGPGDIHCIHLCIAKLSFWRFLGIKHNTPYAQIMPDTLPGDKLPKKIERGEMIQLNFSFTQRAFLAVDPTHVGILDSYHKFHWANKSSLKQAKKFFFEGFKKEPWGSRTQ